MIDTITIIASTTICLFILLRAVQLDRKLAWFPGEPKAGARTAWSPAWDTTENGSEPGGEHGAGVAPANAPGQPSDGWSG